MMQEITARPYVIFVCCSKGRALLTHAKATPKPLRIQEACVAQRRK